MKNIHLNTQPLARLPYLILVEWFLAVRLIILGLVSLAALGVIIFLFYFDTAGSKPAALQQPPMLNTGLVDQLEVWLEARETEKERSIVPAAREYFKH